MTVICVDDEEIILEQISKILDDMPEIKKVTAFNEPEDALQYLKDTAVDIAFLDINMRGINGLNLAKTVKSISPDTDIIFITGYSDYAVDAWKMHANGYLMKPVSADDIREELSYLGKTQPPQKQHIKVQCFGNFDVFYDGIPVQFSLSKTKELFAYLVDRRGASASIAEICAVIWEDKKDSLSMKSYLRSMIADLKKTFSLLGENEILIKKRNSYAVNTSKFWCDSYEFDKGNIEAINSFRNEYMSQYSWGEIHLYEFMEK